MEFLRAVSGFFSDHGSSESGRAERKSGGAEDIIEEQHQENSGAV